jgi:hypothetical protein
MMEKDFRLVLKDISLLVEFPSENKTFTLDTYYYLISLRGRTLEKYLREYLSRWKVRISLLEDGEYFFMPLDMEDEYFGGFRIIANRGHITVSYGFVYDIWTSILKREGDTYVTNLDERDMDVAFSFKTSKEKLLASLDLEMV